MSQGGSNRLQSRSHRFASGSRKELARPGGLALTMSLGVAAAAGSEVRHEPLLRAADQALCLAQADGRNRVEPAGPVGADADGNARVFEPHDSAVELAR